MYDRYDVFVPEPFKAHWQANLWYQAFMVIVQVIMLNLLIAIISEQHNEIRDIAKRIALYERAKLVIEVDQTHFQRLRGGESRPDAHDDDRRAAAESGRSWWAPTRLRGRRWTQEQVNLCLLASRCRVPCV